MSEKSEKSGVVFLILMLCVGYLGIHKFMVGNTTMGIVYILTWGLFGIGTIIDIINLLTGKYLDADGKVISL